MRILLVHRYFWPDVPTYAQILKFLGVHLAAQGHDVSVLSGPVTYNNAYQGSPRPSRETVEGVQVRRVGLPPDDKQRPLLRAASMLVFAARLVLHAARRPSRYDIVTVTTVPPVVMGMAARVVARLCGTRYIYHCMDLYPEAAEAAGLVRSKPLAALARWQDKKNCRAAAAVVVLSEDMRNTLAERGLDVSNVSVINNFEIGEEPESSPQSPLPKQPDRYRVLFAGNMGRFQQLDTLVDAVGVLAASRPELELVFMGSGARVDELKERSSELGGAVKFLDHQPLPVALKVMEESDLAVVSLASDVHKVAYPSKTLMYLKAGCRLLTVVDPDSELARFVQDEGLGATCAPGDVEALVEALEKELSQGRTTATEREHAMHVCERYFGRNHLLERWTELLDELGRRGSAGE